MQPRGPCRSSSSTSILALGCQRFAVFVTVLSSMIGLFTLIFGAVSEPRFDLGIDVRLLQSSLASWIAVISLSGAALCFVLTLFFQRLAAMIDELLPCSARTVKKKVTVESDENVVSTEKILGTARLRKYNASQSKTRNNATDGMVDTENDRNDLITNDHPESDFQILLTELESSSRSAGLLGFVRMLALRWQTDHFSADALYTGFCVSTWCFGLSAPICTLVFERSIWKGRDQVIAYLLVTAFVSFVLAVICVSAVLTSGIGAILTSKRKRLFSVHVSTLRISILPLLASGCSSLLFLVIHIDNGGRISFIPW